MPRVASPNTLVNIIYFRQGGQHFAKRGGQFLGGQMHLARTLGWIGRGLHSIPIIYYHDVVSDGKGGSYQKIDTSTFRAHMEYIVTQGYRAILFNEIPANWRPNDSDKLVVIAFDDGYSSNFDLVFPIMKRLGLPFNIFLTIKPIVSQDPDYLTPSMIEKMVVSGAVSFGAHTFSHVDTTITSMCDLEQELARSDEWLLQLTGARPLDFCFPYGHYNADNLASIAAMGRYKRLYTSDSRPLLVLNGCEIRGRIGIRNEDSVDVLAAKLRGDYNIKYFYHAIKRSIRGYCSDH